MPESETKDNKTCCSILKSKKLVRVTLVKSSIGYDISQKRTVRALGLRKMHQTVEHKDSPTFRGMVAKVSHLLYIEE